MPIIPDTTTIATHFQQQWARAAAQKPPSPEYLAETNQPESALVVGILFLILISLVYMAFVVSRVFFAKRNGWGLWAVYPLSYLSCVCLCIFCILAVKIGGTGRQMQYLMIHHPSTVTIYFKLTNAGMWVYLAGVTFPKICIMMLYIRILDKVKRKVRIAVYVTMAVVVLNALVNMVLFAISCTPYAYYWDRTIPGGRCLNGGVWQKIISVPNMATDGALLALPFFAFWGLQVSFTRKVGLTAVFLTGGIGLVTAILRFVAFFQSSQLYDATFNSGRLWIFTAVEPCCYFLCSCLPGIVPLLNAMHDKFALMRVTDVDEAGSHTTAGSTPRHRTVRPSGEDEGEGNDSSRYSVVGGGSRTGGTDTPPRLGTPRISVSVGDRVRGQTAGSGSTSPASSASSFTRSTRLAMLQRGNSRGSLTAGDKSPSRPSSSANEEGPIRIKMHQTVSVNYESRSQEIGQAS